MKRTVSNIVFGFGTIRFRGCRRRVVADADDTSMLGVGVLVIIV